MEKRKVNCSPTLQIQMQVVEHGLKHQNRSSYLTQFYIRHNEDKKKSQLRHAPSGSKERHNSVLAALSSPGVTIRP